MASPPKPSIIKSRHPAPFQGHSASALRKTRSNLYYNFMQMLTKWHNSVVSVCGRAIHCLPPATCCPKTGKSIYNRMSCGIKVAATKALARFHQKQMAQTPTETGWTSHYAVLVRTAECTFSLPCKYINRYIISPFFFKVIKHSTSSKLICQVISAAPFWSH